MCTTQIGLKFNCKISRQQQATFHRWSSMQARSFSKHIESVWNNNSSLRWTPCTETTARKWTKLLKALYRDTQHVRCFNVLFPHSVVVLIARYDLNSSSTALSTTSVTKRRIFYFQSCFGVILELSPSNINCSYNIQVITCMLL